jgi:hypothetical protein
MTQEAIAPTPERLRKGDAFQPPAKDQKHDRPAYRALSAAAVLLQREEIEPEHYEAAQKFYKHMLGAMGHDVRVDFGAGQEPLEFPRTYHAQMLAKAREELTPREYMIVEQLCHDEATPVSIGFGLSGYVRPDAARPFGVSAINSALDRLSYFWGFKRREPPLR